MKLIKKSGKTTIQISIDEWRKIGIEQGWIKTAQVGGGWELIRRELDVLGEPGIGGALGGQRLAGDQIKLLGGEAFVINALAGDLGIQSNSGQEVAMKLLGLLGNDRDAYQQLDQMIEPLGNNIVNLADQIREGRILGGKDEAVKDDLRQQFDNILKFIEDVAKRSGRQFNRQNTPALPPQPQPQTPQLPQGLEDTTNYRMI